MINVVFLLLVFLLVAARLAPPEGDGPEPPALSPEAIAAGATAAGATAPGAEDLAPVTIDRDGRTSWMGIAGPAALRAAAEACAARCAGAPLRIAADRDAPAAALARALGALRAAGAAEITLRVVPR